MTYYTLKGKIQALLDNFDNLGLTGVTDELTNILNQSVENEGLIQNNNTILSDYIDIWDDHTHNTQLVYPTLAAPVTLTAGAGAWNLGNYIEIIPSNLITVPFDIHFINNGLMSDVTTCELHLFKGNLGNEVLIGKYRFVRLSNQTGAIPMHVITPLLPANTRISGKLASAVGNTTLAVSLSYHEY